MIPISRPSEYAIRAMTYLAQHERDGFCLGKKMAAELDIPAPFLGKVLQPLVVRGLVESQRGRNGGFRLAQPASEVSIYQIVDAHEHLDRPRKCFLGQAECSDERACPMHDFWKGVVGDFVTRLSNTTLRDLIRFCESSPASGYPAPHPT